ncbi:MAG: hypothetical protein P8Z37_08220 [Acidobacteriota bacterium]
MKGKAIHLFITIALVCFIIIAPCGSASAEDSELTPEKIITAHLKSIGPSELLAKAKNRGISGTTSVEFLQGGFGTLGGQCMVISSGSKLSIILKYGGVDYPGEYFTYDGTDVEVATISPGQWSPLGDFIFRYKGLMKEGLLGGVWSQGWALLNLEKRNPKLKYTCTEKIDGRELHEMEYSPKGGLNDIKVKLFFDPDTFHHVRTEYTLRIRGERALQAGKTVTEGVPNLDGSGINTRDAGILDPISDSHYRLVETFDDFKKVHFKDSKGSETMSLDLPHSYAIEYSVEGQGSSFLAHWKLVAETWMQNGKLDPSVFKAHSLGGN